MSESHRKGDLGLGRLVDLHDVVAPLLRTPDYIKQPQAPLIDLPKFQIVPPLQVEAFRDLALLGSRIASMQASLISSLRRFVLPPAYFQELAEFTKRFSQLPDALRPPNWKGVKSPGVRQLETLLLEEGLPLAWVPPSDVLAKLFAAPSAGARRHVLSSNWITIATACSSELDGMADNEAASVCGVRAGGRRVVACGTLAGESGAQHQSLRHDLAPCSGQSLSPRDHRSGSTY